MYDVQRLLQTISEIYSVPGNPERWNHLLAEIGHLVGAEGNAYLLINAEDQSVEVSGTSGFSETVRLRYEGPHGLAKDIRVKYINNLIPGKVFREFEYVPDRLAYDTNEWIQYQLDATGYYWCMSACISTHRLWNDYISVNRLKRRGPHTDDEKTALQELLPHLSRAAELHRLVTRLEDRYGAVLGVLDKLKVGLVILDLRGRVVVANSAARAVCEASDDVRIGGDGRFHARQAGEDASVQALVSRTAMAADARDRCDGGSVVVKKRDHPGSILLEIMPIRDDGFPDHDNVRGTAVFLLDPNSPTKLSATGLTKIFGLTTSENAIVDALVNGADLQEVAEGRRTSIQTVRSQLKSVFAKTGASSQLDLARLVAKATPPFEQS